MTNQRELAFDYLRNHPQTSAKELAQALGIPGRSARRYCRQYREHSFGANTYIFTGRESSRVNLPIFRGHWQLKGDWIAIGDVHLPTTNYLFASMMLDVARHLGIKNLLIAGDLLNMDAFSKFDHLVPPPGFEAEVTPAIDFIAECSGWFDQMKMILGNHEHRLLKTTRGNFKAEWFGNILDAANGKLEVSPYSHVELTSGGEHWRLTHQRNYSRMNGRVANDLAQKYQCNIVTFHQHHVTKRRDTWNRYTLIDGGGLFDYEKMAYVMLTDSTSAVMANGFVVIQDGVGEVVTPYPSYTDLERYGL